MTEKIIFTSPERIFFTSPEHKQRFIKAMQQIGEIYDGTLDPEYAAALYVLTADLANWRKAQTYVKRHGLDIPTMLEEVDFSSGYRVLIQWVGNLFNSQLHCDPIELLRLDERNFAIALSALKIRRYSFRASDASASAPTMIEATSLGTRRHCGD